MGQTLRMSCVGGAFAAALAGLTMMTPTAGQAAALGREMPAGELTRRLAAETLAVLSAKMHT